MCYYYLIAMVYIILKWYLDLICGYISVWTSHLWKHLFTKFNHVDYCICFIEIKLHLISKQIFVSAGQLLWLVANSLQVGRRYHCNCFVVDNLAYISGPDEVKVVVLGIAGFFSWLNIAQLTSQPGHVLNKNEIGYFIRISTV